MSKLNITFKGKKYSIDKSLLSGAIASLEAVFSALSIPEEPEVITYYTYEDIEASGGLLMPMGATNPLYVVVSVSEDYSTITITKNGDDSDGLMMDFPADYVASLGIPFTTVIIENGVVNIGAYLLNNCSINRISVPNSLMNIGLGAFDNCNIEEAYEYGGGLYLGNDINPYVCIMAVDDKSVASFTIHEGTKIIFNGMFSDCESLESIEIPDSVTNIGKYAFYNCSSLTSITFNGTIAQWSAITKGEIWNRNVPATHVHCTDGDVAL